MQFRQIHHVQVFNCGQSETTGNQRESVIFDKTGLLQDHLAAIQEAWDNAAPQNYQCGIVGTYTGVFLHNFKANSSATTLI